MIWHNTIVKKIEQETPSVRRFWLEMPDEATPSFRAGQFITLDLPIGDKRAARWRSYSIANLPRMEGLIELCIVLGESSGAGTRYLFEEVREGHSLRWKGPDGAFTLPDTIDHDLVFVCTGTGIAPFRSMIHDLVDNAKPHRNVHLIFGCRTEADMIYREEMEALARQYPWFRYDAALSRAQDWPGRQGYVHDIYMNEYAHARPDVTFYLCGWSAMVDEAVVNLITRAGYDRLQVRYELYG